MNKCGVNGFFRYGTPIEHQVRYIHNLYPQRGRIPSAWPILTIGGDHSCFSSSSPGHLRWLCDRIGEQSAYESWYCAQADQGTSRALPHLLLLPFCMVGIYDCCFVKEESEPQQSEIPFPRCQARFLSEPRFQPRWPDTAAPFLSSYDSLSFFSIQARLEWNLSKRSQGL